MAVSDRPHWIDGPKNVIVSGPNGESMLYTGHQVLTEKMFERYTFLQALERNQLFVQNSLKNNGVNLLNKVDGVIAPKSTLLQDFIESSTNTSSTHTGGHPHYTAAMDEVLEAFQEAYSSGSANGWYGKGSEAAWLSDQSKKLQGFVDTIRTELVNVDGGLKLHGNDPRTSLSSAETWGSFAKDNFNASTLTFKESITNHPAYQKSIAGSPLFDPRRADSPLNVSTFRTDEQIRKALRDKLGFEPNADGVFGRERIQRAYRSIANGVASVAGALTAYALFNEITHVQSAMAADLNRNVGFEEAAGKLGIAANQQFFTTMIAGAGVEATASALLPWMSAKQAAGLLFEGDGAIDAIRMLARHHKGDPVWDQLDAAAAYIEAQPSYAQYKSNKAWLEAKYNEALNLGVGISKLGFDLALAALVENNGIEAYERYLKGSIDVDSSTSEPRALGGRTYPTTLSQLESNDPANPDAGD